jgi:hypothetical protein
MRLLLIILILGTTAVLAAEVSPEKLAEVRERLVKIADLGDELSKEARTSKNTGAEAKHPTKVSRKTYAALKSWINFGVSISAAAEWPLTDDAPVLRQLLSDNDPKLRALAIEALGSQNNAEDVPRIAELLSDKSQGPFSLERFVFYKISRVTDENYLDVEFEWKVRSVAEHAQQILGWMTGEKFSPDSFKEWWARNKNARECLWYWQSMLSRQRVDLLTAAKGKKSQERDALLNEWAAKTRHTLAALPPEVEAKVLLVARCATEFRGGCTDKLWQPTGVFGAELKLRISKERILELLEQKNVWPDVDLVGDYYNRLFERVMMSSETLFTENDSLELRRILIQQRDKMWWSGRAAGHIGISRLLPRARKDLNDINSREGWLRDAIRSETDVFTRGYVARELIQIGLPANFEFIRDEFFKADTPNAIPNFSQSVLQALGVKRSRRPSVRRWLICCWIRAARSAGPANYVRWVTIVFKLTPSRA